MTAEDSVPPKKAEDSVPPKKAEDSVPPKTAEDSVLQVNQTLQVEEGISTDSEFGEGD